MSTTVNLGMLPQNRGQFTTATWPQNISIYKDNIVQYNGSSYIYNPESFDIEHPEASATSLRPYSSTPASLNTGWAVFASGNNTFTTGQSVDELSIDAQLSHTSNGIPSSSEVFNKFIESGVFDLSAYNAVGGELATYADLDAALTAMSSLPAAYKKGGMSVKFVQSSDNNSTQYVQYRYMNSDASTAATFTNVANWQGVDEEPTAGSKNLVMSGGVQGATSVYKELTLSTAKVNIINGSNKWQTWFTGYSGIMMPIAQGKTYKVTTDNNILSIAILKDNVTTANTTPNYSSQYTKVITVPENSDFVFLTPSDANYIWFYKQANSVTKVFTFSEAVAVNTEIEQIESTYVSTAAQSFENSQKKQARANIGLGNGDIDALPTFGSDNMVKSGGIVTVIGRTFSLERESSTSSYVSNYPVKAGVKYNVEYTFLGSGSHNAYIYGSDTWTTDNPLIHLGSTTGGKVTGSFTPASDFAHLLVTNDPGTLVIYEEGTIRNELHEIKEGLSSTDSNVDNLNGKTDSISDSIVPLTNCTEIGVSSFSTIGKYILLSNPNSFVGITGGGRYKRVYKGEKYFLKSGDYTVGYAFLSSLTSSDTAPNYIEGETVRTVKSGGYCAIIDVSEDCILFVNYTDGNTVYFPEQLAVLEDLEHKILTKENILFSEKFHVNAATAFTKTSTRTDYLKGRTIYFGYYTENQGAGANIYLVPTCSIVGVKSDGTEVELVATFYPLRGVRVLTLDDDYTSIKIKCAYTAYGCDVCLWIWDSFEDNTFYVASSEAPKSFKSKAHFICDGVNDELELNAAANLTNACGTVILSQGTFYVDDIPSRSGLYGAIVKTKIIGSVGNSFLNIIGAGKNVRTEDPKMGTRIFVRDSAFTNVPADTECYVITPTILKNTGRFKITDLSIRIESNNHKVVAINGQTLGAMILDSLSISAADNSWSETPPPPGSVGIRGIMGDCNGTDYIISNTYCGGFYEGFQLGGEHLVMYECGGRFNYYCYTFGNYDYGSWYDQPSEIVTDSHPLTLINCCDEGSRALPKFVKSGVYKLSDQAAKQAINLINFNFEINQSPLPAEEVTPGAFCGIIDFVAYGASNTSKNTTTGSRYNRVDIKFWKDGSGKYFKTTNDAHAESGTTAERLGYWAQPNQQYYDTDLNKMLICTNSETQEWRDFNGNIVN